MRLVEAVIRTVLATIVQLGLRIEVKVARGLQKTTCFGLIDVGSSVGLEVRRPSQLLLQQSLLLCLQRLLLIQCILGILLLLLLVRPDRVDRNNRCRRRWGRSSRVSNVGAPLGDLQCLRDQRVVRQGATRLSHLFLQALHSLEIRKCCCADTAVYLVGRAAVCVVVALQGILRVFHRVELYVSQMGGELATGVPNERDTLHHGVWTEQPTHILLIR
mmetsp:Transcript_47464/g.82910  ORF Transcript_47464/g.82910 Transcript_47464/m.82910 type:complete len:217 (-) Transcript_47464:1185-1835(-)